LARRYPRTKRRGRTVSLALLLTRAARRSQRCDDAILLVEQEEVRRATRQLRDERRGVLASRRVGYVEDEADDALALVLRERAESRAAERLAQDEREWRRRKRRLLKLAHGARDHVEARLVRLNRDEEVATIARAEVNGDGRARKLKDLPAVSARERRPEFFDYLADELVVHVSAWKARPTG